MRASRVQPGDFLDEVRIRNLRGIRDLRVRFSYPVSVLAGANGCGKSTVLSSCACAYRVTGSGRRDFTPGSLFPNFADRRKGMLADPAGATELGFDLVHGGERLLMAWKRGASRWRRTFAGRGRSEQPERDVYLRTLANLANPSEVRGLLQLGRRDFETEEVEAELLIFAHRVLPWCYRNLSVISEKNRDLLFAELEGARGASYSEFHMSSGERAVVRMSRDISRLEGALVLIDEVEAGLHPYTQQLVMLELQRIALRRRLQVIVATHGPVVLESVPPEGRIFLDREVFLDREDRSGDVAVAPPYRDIFQKALYGQSRDRLSVLCEDAVAEGLVLGVLDVVNVRMGLRHDDFVIGRNTGRDEFPGHVRTLGKFGKLRDFVVVLDGDARTMEAAVAAEAGRFGHSLEPRCSCRATIRRSHGYGARFAERRRSTPGCWGWLPPR